MNFNGDAETLVSLLQRVLGAVERKQTMPILGHVLLDAKENMLRAVGSDLDLELSAFMQLSDVESAGTTTVSAKKLLDIVKSLPKGNQVNLALKDNKLRIKSGTSKFNLITLPSDEFPLMRSEIDQIEFNIKASSFVSLLQTCHFAVAQNDVRYFLNGLLIQFDKGVITVVGTDGHRLAKASIQLEMLSDVARSVILPRKAVQEIIRLFADKEEEISIALSDSHFRITADSFEMRSRLIEGKYPDYKRVIPVKGNNIFVVDSVELKDALSQVAVLTNDKYKGVRFQLRQGSLNLVVHNPEQEVAEVLLNIDYTGDEFDIGFNATYVQDVLSHVPVGDLKFYLSDPLSSALLESIAVEGAEFVIMPMRL